MLTPQEQQALDLLLKKKEDTPQPARSVRFTNWTDEDFTWTWGKVPYTVNAHETVTYEDWLARHMAKHLAERELNRENEISIKEQKDKGIKPQDRQEINIVFSPLREQYIKKALGDIVNTAANATELATKMMNPVQEVVIEQAKKPKEVFEGLNEITAKGK